MKIVIYVDYSNKEFNKDFMLSNTLIARGHNVFLAVNDEQFKELSLKCELSLIGISYNKNFEGIKKITKFMSIDDIIS